MDTIKLHMPEVSDVRNLHKRYYIPTTSHRLISRSVLNYLYYRVSYI